SPPSGSTRRTNPARGRRRGSGCPPDVDPGRAEPAGAAPTCDAGPADDAPVGAAPDGVRPVGAGAGGSTGLFNRPARPGAVGREHGQALIAAVESRSGVA